MTNWRSIHSEVSKRPHRCLLPCRIRSRISTTRRRFTVLNNRPGDAPPPKIARSFGGIRAPTENLVPPTPTVHIPKGISIGSAVSAGLVTKRHADTDHATHNSFVLATELLGGPKKWGFRLMTIILSNLNRF